MSDNEEDSQYVSEDENQSFNDEDVQEEEEENEVNFEDDNPEDEDEEDENEEQNQVDVEDDVGEDDANEEDEEQPQQNDENDETRQSTSDNEFTIDALTTSKLLDPCKKNVNTANGVEYSVRSRFMKAYMTYVVDGDPVDTGASCDMDPKDIVPVSVEYVPQNDQEKELIGNLSALTEVPSSQDIPRYWTWATFTTKKLSYNWRIAACPIVTAVGSAVNADIPDSELPAYKDGDKDVYKISDEDMTKVAVLTKKPLAKEKGVLEEMQTFARVRKVRMSVADAKAHFTDMLEQCAEFKRVKNGTDKGSKTPKTVVTAAKKCSIAQIKAIEAHCTKMISYLNVIVPGTPNHANLLNQLDKRGIEEKDLPKTGTEETIYIVVYQYSALSPASRQRPPSAGDCWKGDEHSEMQRWIKESNNRVTLRTTYKVKHEQGEALCVLDAKVPIAAHYIADALAKAYKDVATETDVPKPADVAKTSSKKTEAALAIDAARKAAGSRKVAKAKLDSAKKKPSPPAKISTQEKAKPAEPKPMEQDTQAPTKATPTKKRKAPSGAASKATPAAKKAKQVPAKSSPPKKVPPSSEKTKKSSKGRTKPPVVKREIVAEIGSDAHRENLQTMLDTLRKWNEKYKDKTEVNGYFKYHKFGEAHGGMQRTGPQRSDVRDVFGQFLMTCAYLDVTDEIIEALQHKLSADEDEGESEPEDDEDTESEDTGAGDF